LTFLLIDDVFFISYRLPQRQSNYIDAMDVPQWLVYE